MSVSAGQMVQHAGPGASTETQLSMEALRASLLGRTCFEKWNTRNLHISEDVRPITIPFDDHDVRVEDPWMLSVACLRRPTWVWRSQEYVFVFEQKQNKNT